MEEEKRRVKVVKIAMPEHYANKFIEEARLNFYDNRWSFVMFNHMMFNAMYMQQPEDIKKEIIKARDEMTEKIVQLYKVNKYGKD